MTFHFGVNFLDGFEPLLTWQNEVWMDDCVLVVEGLYHVLIKIPIDLQIHVQQI